MSFEIPGGGGGKSFLPSLRFSAVSGDVLFAKRVQGADGWTTEQQEVALPFRFLADLANLEVGWVCYEGMVDYKVAKIGSPYPAKPNDSYKFGFRLTGFSSTLGAFVFSANSITVVKVIKALTEAYDAEKTKNPGKLPAIEFSGTTTETFDATINGKKVQKKTKAPVLKIIGWSDRPAEFTVGNAAESGEVYPSGNVPQVELDDSITF